MTNLKIPKRVLSTPWFFFSVTALTVMLIAEIVIRTLIFNNNEPFFGFRELVLYESLLMCFSVAIFVLIKKERVLAYMLGFIVGCLLSAVICSENPAFMAANNARQVQFYFSYESKPLMLKPLSEIQEQWQRYQNYEKIYKRYNKRPFRFDRPYR